MIRIRTAVCIGYKPRGSFALYRFRTDEGEVLTLDGERGHPITRGGRFVVYYKPDGVGGKGDLDGVISLADNRAWRKYLRFQQAAE